jgi:D-glycero-alpha-D-manno-heptose-7-phosphate kinase
MLYRSKAPLRIGLAGGGTDVSPYSDNHGGAVLNATLTMYAYCFLEVNDSDAIVFSSKDYANTVEHPLSPQLTLTGQLDLFAHIYNNLMRRFDRQPRGFRLMTYTDAPYGSGLGGSSTLVVAVIKCFAEWWRLPLSDYEIARLAYTIERVDAGLQGGQQDQYAAAFGGLNFMEFFSDRVIVNPLRIKTEVRNELEGSLLLCFTGRSRASADIISSQVDNARTGQARPIEAMHQVKRDAVEMKEAVLTNDLDRFAAVLDRSWANKKQMSSLISNSEIDQLYAFARDNGAKAGKISGAGGGGFMMLCVDPVNKFDLKKALDQRGHRVYDVSFSEHGAQAWRA